MSTDNPSSRNFAPEIARRAMDLPGASPRRPMRTLSAPTRDVERKMIVGPGITLSGEIAACDHLFVEGEIEATLSDCKSIEITDSGVFKGSAQIEEADIGGRFEGELSVRGRLLVRRTGIISGTVHYGEMEIEAGGQIVGAMQPLDPVVTPLPDALAQMREKAGEEAT